MKKWQKFSVIFFVSVPIIFFSPCVNAGGDLEDGDTLPNENHIEPPQNNPPPVNNENNFERPANTDLLGDINNDGELNALDLVVLQKYLNGDVFEINETASDINGDGTISMFDVYALLNLIKSEKKGTGDVNDNGKVDIYDVQTLTAYLANPQNTPINSNNADLNGDGKISTDDLKILRKVIAALQE